MAKPFAGRLKIMLHKRPEDTCPGLSQEQVKKIPAKLLDILLHHFKTESYGDFGTVIKVKDEQHYETFIQMVDWIVNAENAAFLFSRPLEVRRKQGDQTTVRYDPKIHADDADYCTTQTTSTCFVEEIHHYLFSISAELFDLRDHMSKKIRSYPVYGPEVLKLIKQLYSIGNTFTQHVDPALQQFIIGRIKCFRSTLVADAALLTTLRACIPQKMMLTSLVQHANIDENVMGDILQQLGQGIGVPSTADAFLRTFEHESLGVSSDPRLSVAFTRATERRHTPVPGPGEGSDPIAVAVHTLQSMNRVQHIVRADQDCHGTLRPARRETPRRESRDRTFPIYRGEFLVMLPDEGPRRGSNNTRVVCNQHGDIIELSFENFTLTPIQDIPIVASPLPLRASGSKRQRI